MSVGLSEDVLADVLGTRNNGEPILAKSNNLISYDLDTHKPYSLRPPELYTLGDGDAARTLMLL